MLSFLLAALFYLQFTEVRMQLQTCLNGGSGPCLNGTCPNATERCITTSSGEVCCDPTQIVTSSTTATVNTNTTCVDLPNPRTGKPDCPYVSRLCSSPLYIDIMRKQCPKTCGFCSVGGTTISTPIQTACQDLVNFSTGRSDCGARYALCRHPIYRELMSQQCPRTCGYCA